MPKKINLKNIARDFKDKSDDIESFLAKVSKDQSEDHVDWLYNYAIIRLYREFELLMLYALAGAINQDSSVFEDATGVSLPKHVSYPLCEFLIIGNKYFDFKGRDGLIKTIKLYVPDGHYLLIAVKKDGYRDALEKLCALRNFAAHESDHSKKAAKKAIDGNNISSSGAWLKKQSRFTDIANSLKKLAREIHDNAPF